MVGSFTPPAPRPLLRFWRGRFLGAGVDPIALDRLERQVEEWNDWYTGWIELAEESERAGNEALEAGHRLTAGEHLVRASVLYHFGGGIFLSDPDKFAESHHRCVEAYRRGSALLPIPAQPIEFDYDGVPIPGYLRVPPGSDGPAPVVAFVPGWEGSKESPGPTAEFLLARGMATLTIDGPGLGETRERLPLTGNYGPMFTAVLDQLAGRDDVDAGRVGLLGTSRGALLAARATAQEPRIAALATVGPGYETRHMTWGEGTEELIGEYLKLQFHKNTLDDVDARLREDDLTLAGIGEQIHCPTLVVTDDPAGDWHRANQYAAQGDAITFYEEVAGPKRLAVIPGADRNGYGRIYLVRPLVADWLADQLGARGA